MSLLEKRTKGSKEIDHESSQFGTFENVTIRDRMSDPYRFEGSSGDGAATLADSPDSLSEHLISRSSSASSPLSPAFPCSAKSPSFRGSATHQMLLKKRKDEKDTTSRSFDGKDEFPFSRWDSGRWSGARSSFEECFPERLPPGKRVCNCAAGLTADVAVVCCCPLSLLHLLTIALFKLPKAVVSKTVTTVKRKVAEKRKRAAAVHEEEEESSLGTSRPLSRCRSYEARRTQIWSPMPVFGDEKMWRDCNFDYSDNGVSSDGEPLRGKS